MVSDLHAEALYFALVRDPRELGLSDHTIPSLRTTSANLDCVVEHLGNCGQSRWLSHTKGPDRRMSGDQQRSRRALGRDCGRTEGGDLAAVRDGLRVRRAGSSTKAAEANGGLHGPLSSGSARFGERRQSC